MTFRCLFLPGCLACLFGGVSSASARDGFGSASLAWVENVSRTSHPPDERDALVAEARAGAAWTRALPANWTFTHSLDAALGGSPDYDRLRTARLGGGLALRHKFGLGPDAPALDVRAQLARNASAIPGADRWQASGALRLSRRWAEIWHVALSAGWEEDLAESRTFDTGLARLQLEFSWDLTPRWRLSAGAAQLRGAFTADAAPLTWQAALAGAAGARVAEYYRTVSRQVTGTYGSGWVSYRVRGDIRTGWIELSPALSDRSALALRYEHALAENRAEVTYRQERWSLSWISQW